MVVLVARRKKVEAHELSNDELLREHKARAKHRAPERALCVSTQNQGRDGDRKTYKCWRCKTFKPSEDYHPFQLVKPFSMICIECQTTPIFKELS